MLVLRLVAVEDRRALPLLQWSPKWDRKGGGALLRNLLEGPQEDAAFPGITDSWKYVIFFVVLALYSECVWMSSMVITVRESLGFKVFDRCHSGAASRHCVLHSTCNCSAPKLYQWVLKSCLQPGLWCNGISLYDPPAAPGQREGGKEQETDKNGAVIFLIDFSFLYFC